MKLYSMTGTCALSVHIALEWAGAPYELVMMPHGDNRKPEFLAINPSGMVPTVVLDDGQVLTEAAAILAWVVDSYPVAELGASSAEPLARFDLEEALAFLTGEVHGAFGPYFAPQRFLADEGQAAALKTTALGRVAGHMQRLDARLGDQRYLLGDRTVADAYLYVLTRWADYLSEGIAPYPNLRRFRAAIESDDKVAGALAAQGLERSES